MGTPTSGGTLLDALMARLQLTNADLVRASTEQLTFKMVQKGRKGRKLTFNVQHKILSAIHGLRPDEKLGLGDIFITLE